MSPYPSPTCRICGFRLRRQGMATCGTCSRSKSSLTPLSCAHCGADLHARPHEISEGKHYCLAGCATQAKENR